MESSEKILEKPIQFYMKEFVRSLGGGAYGQVFEYLGQDGKSYAIKKTRKFQNLFKDICIQTCVNSEYIVPIIGMYYFQTYYQIVMPIGKFDIENEKFINRRRDKHVPKMLYQMVQGVKDCHNVSIIHCDIKPQNFVFFSQSNFSQGTDFSSDTIKLADFGLAKIKACGQIPNDVVYTLWFRPPEVLLGGTYNGKADVWALACSMYFVATKKNILMGRDEADQVAKMNEMFGSFTELTWPNVSMLPRFSLNKQNIVGTGIPSTNNPLLDDLFKKMLEPNPLKRFTIYQVCNHPYFNLVREKIIEKNPTSNCDAISCFDALKNLDKPRLNHSMILELNNGIEFNVKSRKFQLFNNILKDWTDPKTSQVLFGGYEIAFNSACFYLGNTLPSENVTSIYKLMGWLYGPDYVDLKLPEFKIFKKIVSSQIFQEYPTMIRVCSLDYWNFYISFYSENVKKVSFELLKIMQMSNMKENECALCSIILACIAVREKFLHPLEDGSPFVLQNLDTIKNFILGLECEKPRFNEIFNNDLIII